jgi:hypothetical protein
MKILLLGDRSRKKTGGTGKTPAPIFSERGNVARKVFSRSLPRLAAKQLRAWIVLPIIAALLLTSCAITTPPVRPARPALHRYYFEVKEGSGVPVEGASITATLYNHNERKNDTMLATDAEGKAAFSVMGTADASDSYQNLFETTCDYSAFKIGYLPEYGTAKISYLLADLSARGHKGRDETSTAVTLYRVDDLISETAGAIADTAEKNAVLRYAENLHRAFNARGITVSRHSIDILAEAGKQYLSATLNTPNVMNADRLDSEGIAKTFFELAGREAFEILREDSERMNDIDGLSLSLTGTKKHFNIPADDPVPVECRFRIDKKVLASTESTDQNGKFLLSVKAFVDGKEILLSK